MAATAVTFSLENGVYVSDTITPSGNQFVLEIIFDTPGQCILERRLTDNGEWIEYVTLTNSHIDKYMFLTTISGATPGESIRIRFDKNVIPSSIKILES